MSVPTSLERMLAAQNPLTQMDRPHQLFADAPPIQPQPPQAHVHHPAMPQLGFMPPPHMHHMGKEVVYFQLLCNEFMISMRFLFLGSSYATDGGAHASSTPHATAHAPSTPTTSTTRTPSPTR